MVRDADIKLNNIASRLRLPCARDHMSEMIVTTIETKMVRRAVLMFFFTKEFDQHEPNRIKIF